MHIDSLHEPSIRFGMIPIVRGREISINLEVVGQALPEAVQWLYVVVEPVDLAVICSLCSKGADLADL